MILLLWNWHLAQKLKQKLKENWKNVNHLSFRWLDIEKWDSNISKFEFIKKLIEKSSIKKAEAICIMDDEDNHNIELSLIVESIIKDTTPLYVSLYNISLWKYLKKNHNNLHIINPASIAAPFFIKKFEKNKESLEKKTKKIKKKKSKLRLDSFLLLFFLLFILIYVVWILYFKEAKWLSWIDSIYFTTVTVASVWYWDINLSNSSFWTKVFWIWFIFTSMVTVWIFFSLFIDNLMKMRYEATLWRKKYNIKNHIIICWLWRVWLQLVEELSKTNEKMIVVESNKENRFLETARSKKAKVFIWDASLPSSLEDVWINNADWIFVMVNNDMKNLEIALNAISLNPDIPMIVRIYDESLAEKVRNQLKIPNAYSNAEYVSDYILKKLS